MKLKWRHALAIGFGSALVFPATGQAPAPAPSTPVTLAWEVESRFRLWGDGDAAQRADLETLYASLAGTPDPGTAHDAIVRFLRTHRDIWKHLPWDPASEGYKTAYLFPSDYAVAVGLQPGAAAPGAMCIWSADIGTFDRVRLPCSAGTRLTISAIAAAGSAPAHITITATDPAGASQAMSATIEVSNRVVVSIGDSFASGEGNPDVPANLGALAGGPGVRGVADTALTWLGRSAMDGVKMAHWADPVCHRSMYNQHLVAALKYAADRPHEAVTFVSYACSGAEIFSGLLVPQAEPPGYDDSPTATGPRYAQVEALVRDLCIPNSGGTSAAVAKTIRYDRPSAKWGWFGYRAGTDSVSTTGFTCPTPRKPDALLLSIGGNDVYFAAIIMGKMLPATGSDVTSKAILKYVRAAMAKDPAATVAAFDYVLQPSLQALDRRLADGLGGTPVIQSAYPSPINGETGKCGPPQDPVHGQVVPVLGRLAAPNGLWPENQSIVGRDWTMSISQADGLSVEYPVVESLRARLADNASVKGWTFAQAYLPLIAGHGWCAGNDIAEQAVLPTWDATQAAWTPWDPSRWDPYIRRARLFRTPNDSALTEMQEQERQSSSFIASHILGHRQFLLMNALAGSFHPTFQAHVIMGLEIGGRLEQTIPSQ